MILYRYSKRYTKPTHISPSAATNRVVLTVPAYWRVRHLFMLKYRCDGYVK